MIVDTRPMALLALGLTLCGCHSNTAEPAPPPASYELVVAPPWARGARAAGTDAAPPPPGEGELAEPGDDEAADPDPEADDDGGVDAGPGVVPNAGPGVAL